MVSRSLWQDATPKRSRVAATIVSEKGAFAVMIPAKIFNADLRMTDPVVGALSEAITIEQAMHYNLSNRDCAHCGRTFSMDENEHLAQDGEDVCESCCDVCTDDEKKLPIAICPYRKYAEQYAEDADIFASLSNAGNGIN